MNKFIAVIVLNTILTSLLFANKEIAIDQVNYGSFSGKLQLLSMQLDFSDKGNANSTTGALTLNYQSSELFDTGLSLKLQYIHAEQLFSGGGNADAGKKNAGQTTNNGAFSVLNEAYLQWELKSLGLGKTSVRVGRQIINHDFACIYNPRQKDLAVEGIVFTFNELEDIRIKIGHIERYSSWSGRGQIGRNSAFDWHFSDVEDVITSAARLGDGIINSNGMQTFSFTYKGIEDWNITLWDVYANELINTVGADIYYTVNNNLKLNVKYSQQQAMGELDELFNKQDRTLESKLADFNCCYKLCENSTIKLGIYKVFGENSSKRNEDFLIPFSFDHDAFCTRYVKPYETGTEALYIKSSTKINATKVTVRYIYANHNSRSPIDSGHELALFVGQKFSDQFSIKVKVGLGYCNNSDIAATHETDLRLYMTYSF